MAWLLVVALLLSACATRNVPGIGADGELLPPEVDERSLWAQAEREEAALLKAITLYDDPLLEEYLARIGDRLIPGEVRAAGGPGYRVRVIRDPSLNAFAMPNGRVYVHTGLLARIENEAQLATILGHELTHVTHRHALRFTRDAQSKPLLVGGATVAASIRVAVAPGSRASSGDQIGGAVMSQTARAVLGLGLQLAALASINGYGRDLEREADVEGLERLVRAGYDSREALRVLALLTHESGDRGSLETFFFGSPARLQERIETTRELLRTRSAVDAACPDRVKNTEEFELRMRTVVRDNAQLDLRAGRFNLAGRQLERVLAVTPNDPIAHLYYGDLHRLQAQRVRTAADKADSARKALARYERAAELDPTFPDPHRQLGLLHYQQKQNDQARAAFRRYLALTPDAPDARRIREYLTSLDRRIPGEARQ